MYNVSRLWWIPFIIGIVAGIIATLLWNLLIGIIAAVVVFFIVSCMGKSDEDILKRKAEAGDQDAQRELDELSAKTKQASAEKAKVIYEKAVACINHAEFLEYEIEKTGYRHLHEADMNKNFERGVKLLNQAIKLGNNDATEALNRYRKKRDTKYAENSKKENARLDALPKCPRCGGPIEAKYVDQYWGSRYYHATYAPNCTWSDDKLREPYQPR